MPSRTLQFGNIYCVIIFLRLTFCLTNVHLKLNKENIMFDLSLSLSLIVYISATEIFKFEAQSFLACFIIAIYQQQFYKVVDAHNKRPLNSRNFLRGQPTFSEYPIFIDDKLTSYAKTAVVCAFGIKCIIIARLLLSTNSFCLWTTTFIIYRSKKIDKSLR